MIEMFTKIRIQQLTWTIATAIVVCIVAGYAAVAASTHLRPPSVVVSFNIEQVVADLTEKADSEARLRTLVNKIEDERTKRFDTINALKSSMETASDADRVVIADTLEQRTLEAVSYQRFAAMQIDSERSLMLRDIYLKIKAAVAIIAQENGYDIVLISDVQREVVVNPQSDIPREIQILERIGLQRAMYTSTQTDITEQIVTHMNLEWEKRSTN
jgi:Skp family chaperone for outer membrane proteins